MKQNNVNVYLFYSGHTLQLRKIKAETDIKKQTLKNALHT